MKGSILAVAALATPFTSAISLAPRSANPHVIGLDITKSSISDPVARDRARLAKRQKTVTENLDNEETLYYANITLGTPEQQLRLSIDTGSSDLWVNTPDSSFCQQQEGVCQGGTYSQSDSSSAKTINNDFNISYVDGSGALGNYVSDVLHFGGVTLDKFQFGVGLTSQSQIGVLGIGYANSEVQVNRAGGDPYPNLPQALVDSGSINTPAYSLWLNDLNAPTGTILFGGVNAAKYSGDLVTVPVIPVDGVYFELRVGLSEVQYDGKSISSNNLPAGVILDSGTSLIYLPDDIVKSIYGDLNIVYDSSTGTAYGYCDDATSDKSVSFTFSGQTISVPLSEMFLPAGTDQNGQPIQFKNGRDACIFGISPSDGSTPLLGDVFLRSAYVVYDLQNNEISLAKTVFNTTDDDIREISTGTNGVPSATAAASPVTSVVNQQSGGGARLGGGTATGDPNSIPTGAASRFAPGTLNAIGMTLFGVFLAL